MSRGMSKRQSTILAILRGRERCLCFASGVGGMDTKEILQEMLARGLVNEYAPHRQQMATVLRSCSGLVGHGLEGTYVRDADFPGAFTVSWTATREPPPVDPSSPPGGAVPRAPAAPRTPCS